MITQTQLSEGFAALGVPQGGKVLVHSSLRSLGLVEGGADAVIDSLLAVLGPTGTLLAPTLTGSEELSPQTPPIFDPARTPAWTGIIPETLRRRPAATRSLHPTHSAAAIGADAAALLQGHARSVTPCDEWSPYGELARREDGYILLIGVTHRSNTTFHHVEEVAGLPYHMQPGFAAATVIVDGAAQDPPYHAAQVWSRPQFRRDGAFLPGTGYPAHRNSRRGDCAPRPRTGNGARCTACGGCRSDDSTCQMIAIDMNEDFL